MPIFRFKGMNILFVHIPKTGGSAIEEYYSRYAKLSLERFNSRELDHACIPRHLHGPALEKIIDPQMIDLAFMVVRNPVDRLLSDYKYYVKRKKRETNPPSFSYWMRYRLWRSTLNSFYMDNHFRPQWEFHCHNAKVFLYENGLERAVAEINDIIGLKEDPVLKRINKSPLINIQPSSRDVDFIQKFYREDFERFHYSYG